MTNFLFEFLNCISPILFLSSVCSALVGVATIIGLFLKLIGKNEGYSCKWHEYFNLFSTACWICYFFDIHCKIIEVLAAIAMVKFLIETIIQEINKYRNKKRTN